MRAVVVKPAGWMPHVLTGLQSELLCRRPFLRPLAGVPRALQHDAVPLVRMRMRPAHHARGKLVDREIETGIRRIAFEDSRLHAKLVVLRSVPLQVVEVQADEFPIGKRAGLRLPVCAWSRGLLRS